MAVSVGKGHFAAFALTGLLVMSGLVTIAAVPAGAVNRSFPGAWTNPVSPATFEDWGFASCNPPYVPGVAHLGADSQGTHANQVVLAMAGGTVVGLTPSGWPGAAIGIEHAASDGTRFVAVYGHVNSEVAIGNPVAAGQRIATLYDQGGNSHLHLGIRPLAGAEAGTSVTIRGQSACTSTAPAPAFGYVDPVPFLAARSPGAGNVFADGSFVSYQSAVYRMAGGAPIYVSDWATVGGPQPAAALNDAQWQSLRPFPRDNTLLSGSDGAVYKVAGGAPIYVSNWASIGGEQATIRVDAWAIANTAHPAAHLRTFPLDGTLVSVASGSVYRFAGGAPIYVSSWAAIGGEQATTRVDEFSLENTAPTGPLSHVRYHPADGTILRGGATDRYYRVSLGSPSPTSPTSGAVTIDQVAIDNAGAGGIWNHLKAVGMTFHPLSPTRILDSRPAGPQAGPYGTPWGAGVSRDVTVTGVGSVPAGATAIALNVTVTSTTAMGFLTIWPAGQPQPLASSLNWAPGQTIPNAVTVKVGSAGKVSVYNPFGDAHVVFDVVGYYDAVPGDGFTPLTPARILDSRPGGPVVGPYSTPWGPTQARDVAVAGVGGVPQGADAVLVNVTVTQPTAVGFLTIWPAGQSQPLASSLNWSAGQTIPNAVTVKVGTGGKVSVYNSGGQVDVIFDVVGFFSAGSGQAFHPLSPTRIQDSRATGPQVGPYDTPWGEKATRNVQVTGAGAVPAGAGAALLNVTVTQTTAPSFLTVWPTGQPLPLASSLNWVAGDTIPNSVTTKLSSDGAVSVRNSAGNVHVVADVAGWYG